MKKFEINFHGDSTIIVKFGKKIEIDTNEILHFVLDFFEKALLSKEYIEDIYPTYNSIVVDYDMLLIDFEDLKNQLENIIHSINLKDLKDIQNKKTIEIAVKYGGEFGPDLKLMSKKLKISEEEIINIHTSKTYRVYMIGFMPGFPYLGGLDERIFFPRLSEPRLSVSEGSVGIAGQQTGIYPFSSPGGWNIIGHTDQKLFDVENNPPNFIKSGSNIRFVKK